MRIAVGSRNPVKVGAVADAMAAVWPDDPATITGVDVPSGVRDQPMSFAETLAGARQRARLARAAHDAAYGIGIESGLGEVDGTWYSMAWIVAIDEAGREGHASTSFVPLPPRLLALVHDGLELGAAIDRVVGGTNTKQRGGMTGMLTRNVLTRREVFRNALIVAFAPFHHPDLYAPLHPRLATAPGDRHAC